MTIARTAETSLSAREAELLVQEAMVAGRLERVAAERLAENLTKSELRALVMEAAAELKQRGKGKIVTVSRNVFIPLTNLCRNRCAYCTFAQLPDSPEAKTLAFAEVETIACEARAAGCVEALFCLGDKPEIAYRGYRDWLASLGYASTAEYLLAACERVFHLGLLPHSNAGILTRDEMVKLQQWNASLGLMLETTSVQLRRHGMAHYYAPDKEPARRIRMHEEAGELKIPFTSGLLFGIGETTQDRVESLFVLRDLQDRFGNLQEIILQPFHAKLDTPMAESSQIDEAEFVGWVALARLILGPEINLQAPPNLNADAAMLKDLLRAGINDWGGVSPLTQDFINPEAPWPTLERLREVTQECGQELRERLPVYPEWICERSECFAPAMLARIRELSDAQGFARTSSSSSEAAV